MYNAEAREIALGSLHKLTGSAQRGLPARIGAHSRGGELHAQQVVAGRKDSNLTAEDLGGRWVGGGGGGEGARRREVQAGSIAHFTSFFGGGAEERRGRRGARTVVSARGVAPRGRGAGADKGRRGATSMRSASEAGWHEGAAAAAASTTLSSSLYRSLLSRADTSWAAHPGSQGLVGSTFSPPRRQKGATGVPYRLSGPGGGGGGGVEEEGEGGGFAEHARGVLDSLGIPSLPRLS